MARNNDFDWSAIGLAILSSSFDAGERFIINIWLLIRGLEEHELDGCNMKFEVGALIPMADSDIDERLRLGLEVPGDVVAPL